MGDSLPECAGNEGFRKTVFLFTVFPTQDFHSQDFHHHTDVCLPICSLFLTEFTVGPVCDRARDRVPGGATYTTPLTCGQGQIIGSITSAFFGRTDASICPTLSGIASATTCTGDESAARQFVQNLCIGLQSCTPFASPSMDPCPGTDKYWFVTYTCYSGEPTRMFNGAALAPEANLGLYRLSLLFRSIANQGLCTRAKNGLGACF